MNDAEKLAALQTYFDLMSMNGASRVFRTAHDLGIFSAVAQQPVSASEVAAACGLRVQPASLLLDALDAIGTVIRDNDRFTLAPVMQFLAGNYQQLSDEYWDYLPSYLQSGVPLAEMDSVEQSAEQYEKQVTALAWMMTPAAEAMAQMLGIGQARKSLRILDVGAGSGIWSLTCAQHDPGTMVTVSDWPVIVDIATAFAANMGLSERFSAIPGNYHEADLGESAYDLAIVANVTHIETPDGNRDLFSRIHRALKPGGEIVLVDVMGTQPQGRIPAALYALGLGLRTAEGQVHSPESLQQYLTESGFSAAVPESIPVPPYTMGMILASRES